MRSQNKVLKRIVFGLCSILIVGYCYLGQEAGAFSSGPPASHTGAPALGSIGQESTCTECHTSFDLNSGPGTLTLTGLPANYTPNQELTLTVTLSQTSRARYGFQLTALDDQGRKAGDLIVTDATRTRLISGGGTFDGRQYLEHTQAGVTPNGTNQNSWTFRWKAPAQSVGRVTFYVAGNAANGNFNNQGDYIYNITASVQPGAALATVTSVSAASYATTPTLTSDTVAALFGADLATGVLSAAGLPLPTDLGGTKVKVRDNAGTERDAGLFFVSTGQINYLIPAGTANGAATVTVTRNNTPIATGAVTIDTVAPGLFAANANGQGVAAAVVFRLKANGQQLFEPLSRFDQTQGRVVPVPIDLGPDTDQVFLILYGTGFRGRSALSAVTCQIGGASSEVLFAAAAPDFVGLDQANVRLPRSLGGRGDVNIAFTVDGKAANTLTVNVK